jgi:hypothetical protein
MLKEVSKLRESQFKGVSKLRGLKIKGASRIATLPKTICGKCELIQLGRDYANLAS